MKNKETLEERKPYWNLVDIKAEQNNIIDLNAYANGVEDGVKWQKEQDKNLYSEEEVHNIIESYQYNIENNPIHITYDKWFEQFKKK